MTTYAPLQCRWVEPIGWRSYAGVGWDAAPGVPCVVHVARHGLAAGAGYAIPDDAMRGWSEHPWPDDTPCEQCGSTIGDAERHLHGGTTHIYDTPSGQLEPGSLFWKDHHDPADCWLGWTNCDGHHLACLCPNGCEWIIDQRASNCTRHDDTTHRCWVRTGEPWHPETLTVGKAGDTCSAGAGSIICNDFHGFLRAGVLVPC